jgi:hypothetical protein
MTDDLVQWLRAQLDDDERIARRAAEYDDGAAHDVDGPAGTWTCLDESEWFGPSHRGGVIAPRIGAVNAPELGNHIVRHDPARVLREIDAKRQVISRFVHWAATMNSVPDQRDIGVVEGLEMALRMLAAVYADRPGYKVSWRP